MKKPKSKPFTPKRGSEVRHFSEQKFCSWCGQKMTYINNVARCSGCGYIHYLNAKPTTAVLLNHNDKVLLVRRGIEPNKGKFDLPGGFVDMGDVDFETATLRELKEELGLNKTVTDLSYVGSGKEDYEWHKTVVTVLSVYFSCSLSEEDVTLIRLDSENSEYRIITRAELATIDLAWNTDKLMMQKFWKYE